MTNQWMQLEVKAIAGAQIKRLDDHLCLVTAAAVEQAMNDGKYFYQPSEDGTYTVRVFDCAPMQVAIVKGVIMHNGFCVVSEQTHD